MLQSIKSRITSEDHLGLFMSGGFDSTTLAYAVFKIVDVFCYRKPSITVYAVPRYDDSTIHVDRVCQWLNKKFPSIVFTKVHLGNPDLHHSAQVLSGIIEAKNINNNLIILGDTRNPDDRLLANGPIRTKSKDSRIYQPFIDSDKSVVVNLANELRILNEVSEISHTCTESKLLRCGKCWQCRERKWAFNKLNLVDIGKM